MATPMAAPPSMASMPTWLQRWFSSAMASMSPIPQLDPSRPMFSYCREATVVFPEGSAKTLEQAMMHPCTQGRPRRPSPPRRSISSAIISPEIASACSKRPSRKLRVGRMPRVSHRARTAGVPKLWRLAVFGSSLRILASSRAAAARARGSAGSSGRAPSAVEHDGLDALRAHDRAQAAAAGQPQLHAARVGRGHGGRRQAHFAGRTDAQGADPFTEALPQGGQGRRGFLSRRAPGPPAARPCPGRRTGCGASDPPAPLPAPPP